MITELSTKEKIATLEYVLNRLQISDMNYWICNLIARYCRLRIDDTVDNTDAIILIPEILKYKPEECKIDSGWFPSYDYQTRIKVVKKLLKDLKRRKT